jgi:hypothetical protein
MKRVVSICAVEEKQPSYQQEADRQEMFVLQGGLLPDLIFDPHYVGDLILRNIVRL